MKKTNKILFSIISMALVASVVSVFATGNAGAIALPVIGVLFAIGFAKGLLKINFIDLRSNMLYDGFVIADTTYAGEAASSFIVKAITGNEMVEGGNIYVKDGIKKAFTIPRWDADFEDLIQPRSATPISKGTMNVDGRLLAPADYMIYVEFNPRDYEAHWYATQLNPTLIDRSLPATVESTVIQEVTKRHDRYINKAMWISSVTSNLADIYKFYNGINKKAAMATTGTDQTNIVASPITLTNVNIATELLRGWQLLPAAVRYNPDMKIFVSFNTYDLFMQYQINQTYKGNDISMDGVPRFKGRELVKVNDIPDNFYFMAVGKPDITSNLWFGLNSSEDAKITLKPLQSNSEVWFVKMLMKADVQIGFSQETVLYGGLY